MVKLLQIFLLLMLAVGGVFSGGPTQAAQKNSIFDMVDQFDAADKLDFQAVIDRANACTRDRNFSCSESELSKAAKVANSSQDKKTLALARQNIANEKARVAGEERQRQARLEEERQRQARLEEEQQRQARLEEEREEKRERQRRAERDREDEEDDRAEPIDDWRKKDDAFWRNARQQDSARITEGYRKRDEQQAEQARQRAESNERAAEQRKEAQRDRNARVARADTEGQQRQLAEQGRAREQELSRQKQAKETADRLAVEQDRAREQESNRQRQDKEKADKLAAQQAGKAAEEQAKNDYLAALLRETKLHVRNCYGKYSVVGIRPKIKPEVVGCVDVHFRARCAGNPGYIQGVGKTFVGMGTDCFTGDTYEITPKPMCPVEQVQIEATAMRACGK